jgi:hypothetical protein
MSDYFIKIDKFFSTSFFYERVLKELHNCLRENINHRVIFDFSETVFVDALVIPNLLCVGGILRETTGQLPVITTINNYIYTSRTNVAQYLSDIGFTAIAQSYNLFEFSVHSYKRKSTLIKDYSTTYLFDNPHETKQNMANRISRKSRELFETHLKEYFDEDDVFGYCNIFAKFAAELCNNSLTHGKSCSYMTIQSNLEKQKISIAVSDYGRGFYNSLYEKILSDDTFEFHTIDKDSFKTRSENSSLYAIIESTFYRYFNKDYGIWNIADTVLGQEGIIRIHSTDARIILTPNKFPLILAVCSDAESLKEVLSREFIERKDYNYKSGLKFPGVHYEIEMPLKISRKGGAYNAHY